jgi:outer membrane protein insertion porin family
MPNHTNNSNSLRIVSRYPYVRALGVKASPARFVKWLRCGALCSVAFLVPDAVTGLVGFSPIQSGYAQEVDGSGYLVDGVIVDGNRRIDGNAIKAQLKHTSGSVTSSQINADVKTLYNTGFFDQVVVSVVASSSGRPKLKYSVIEKPVARKIFIKGNKEVSESDLTEVLKVDARRFVDKSKITGLIKRAESFYQSKGFYDATFDYSTVPVGENEVDLTFTVKEGTRYRVREVVLRGVKELETDEMLSGLQVKDYKWWNSWLFGTGRVNQEMLEADKQILRQYLLDHGFLEGAVGEASVEKREDGLYVVFDITEGQQFKVGRIKASGDLIENDEDKTLAGINAERGEVFNASQVREDIFKITDKFADIGYAFANVVPQTSLNKSTATVDLDFTVAKGNLVRVNRINVSGNEKTYDNVVRRTLTIEEQEIYSGSKIKRSQTLLQRLGYFDEATITNQPTDDPNKVDLNVNVKEGTTGSFSAGAGYATSNGAIFNTRLSENNIFGTGRRANINLDFGSFANNQIVSLDDPRVNDSNLALGVDLMRTDRNFFKFERQLVGGAVTAGYPAEELFGEWGQDINLTLKYDYSSIDITNIDEEAAPLVRESEGKITSSSLTPGIVRNTINNPLNPTRGSRQQLSLEVAGLGGEADFYLFEIRNQWYYPIIETSVGEIVVSNRTTFDYGESNNDEQFPLFRRFFPGGINSVRGYRVRSLGPTDEDGNEYGGSKQFLNAFEVIFPLLNSAGFRGVVFYDVGQAFDDDQSISFPDLRQAVGYGIRWNSPLGPIRIEIGYPIDRQKDERSVVPMFSFGAPIQ